MPRRDRDYRTIGEVVQELKDSHPDLTVSKVRFLEDEGLIAPGRTPGGYRKFTGDDVARIEVILKMQRDHFLPLAVIRERLSEIDQGRVPEELRNEASSVEAARLPIDEASTVPLKETLRELGVPADFVRELARYGLVVPIGSGEAAEVVRSDADVARAAWALRRFGIEPRHLKMFDQFAEREASLYEQALMPSARLRTPEAREKVVRQLEEMTGLVDDAKRRLLKRALGRTFEDVT